MQTALEQVAVNVLDGHVRACVADAVAGDGDEARREARRADGRRAPVREGPLGARARAGAVARPRGLQHSSRNAAISSVSRSGARRSSMIEFAFSRRPFGSSSASIPASENGWIDVVPVADHERRRLERAPLLAVRRDAAEEQALDHRRARPGSWRTQSSEDVDLPRQPRLGSSRAAARQQPHAGAPNVSAEHQRRERDARSRAARCRAPASRSPSRAVARARARRPRASCSRPATCPSRPPLDARGGRAARRPRARTRSSSSATCRSGGRTRRGRAGRASRRGGRARRARAPARRASAG